MDIIILAIIILVILQVLARISYLASVTSVTLSRDEFFACLGRMDAPAVLVRNRTVLWLFGLARYHYTCVYKGLRLHLRSFSPVNLPSSTDAIEVRRW
jgi:hypothetical protein